MLTQADAEALMEVSKSFVDRSTIQFPMAGSYLSRELKSNDGRESFLVDVNRKGRIKLSRCTFQERYEVVEILLRLDIDGPDHENPDGQIVPCPHLHIYKEGFADKWASPLTNDFTDPTNLLKTFREFLHFCHVAEIPDIQSGVV